MEEQIKIDDIEIDDLNLPPTPAKPKNFHPPNVVKKIPPKIPPRSQSPIPPPRKAPQIPPKRSGSLKKMPLSSLKKIPSFGSVKGPDNIPKPPPRPQPPPRPSEENNKSEEETNKLSNIDNNDTSNTNVEENEATLETNKIDDVEVNSPEENFESNNGTVVDEEEIDDELPPPPPMGDSDFAFDSYQSPDENNGETSFKNVFTDNENVNESTDQNTEDSSLNQGESEYSDNDPPPQNLEPLPPSLHPKVPPPNLPPGIVHPDTFIVNLDNNAEESENKKKKGKFTSQLKGLFKNKKKKDEDDKKNKSKPKEEEQLVSAISDRLERYFKLIDLLSRDDMYLLNIMASLVSRGDVDKQSRAWVRIFGPKGCLLPLLLSIIRNEVEKTEHEGTLFRNNTFPVGLLSQYAHFTGKEYLKTILVDNLLEIINDEDKRYEINPDGDGMSLTPDEIDQNTMNLLSSCEKIFNSIISSKDIIPPEIRRICKELRDRVREKFPNAVHTCVGGFLFLRFITPSIVSPEGYQLLNAEITVEKRRPLILISKTLQQISNDMYFSEEYLMSINSFITENVPILQSFFEEVCDVDENVKPNPFPEIALNHETLRARDDALIRIHQFILKVLPEIKNIAQEISPAQVINYDPIAELEKCLEALGEPPDPKILKQPVVLNTKKKDKKK